MATTPKGIPGIEGGTNWNLKTDWQNTIDAIDKLLDGRGTAAQRAAATLGAPNGTLWQDTDGAKIIWRKDGSAWVPAVWHHGGTTAQMNAFTQAPEGFKWFNTTDNAEYNRLGGAWVGGGWVNCSLAAGVQQQGASLPRVRREGNLVRMRWGVSGSGFAANASKVAFRLPAGFAPSGSNYLPIGANSAATQGISEIAANGEVSVRSSSVVANYYMWDGVTYTLD